MQKVSLLIKKDLRNIKNCFFFIELISEAFQNEYGPSSCCDTNKLKNKLRYKINVKNCYIFALVKTFKFGGMIIVLGLCLIKYSLFFRYAY